MSHSIENVPPKVLPFKAVVSEENPKGVRAQGQTLPADGQSLPPKASVKEEAHKVVEAFTAQAIRRELHFSVDEASGRMVIKVIDRETQEVIRQIPPEEVLALARHLAEDSLSREGLMLKIEV